MIEATFSSIAERRGWSALLLAFLAGAISSAGFAPLYFWPAAIAGFALLILLIRRSARPLRCFFLGWLFGCGQLLLSLFWIGHAFLVDTERFLWLLPFAVALLPMALAAFMGLATAITVAIGGPPWIRILSFASIWVFMEWARTHLFTGFPWNLTGHIWADWLEMMQPAAYVGAYGMSFLTILAASGLTLFLVPGQDWRLLRRLSGLLPAIILPLASYHLAESRLPPLSAEPQGPLIRIVQGNIAQAEKWQPALRAAHFRQYLTLSHGAERAQPDIVVWPETATAFFLDEAPDALTAIGAHLPDHTVLLTGAPRRDELEGERRIYNSIHLIDGRGEILTSYDKFHLVPFGEYVPLRWLLARLGLQKLAAGQGDFTAGPGPVLLLPPDLPSLQPLVCYEIIFPNVIEQQPRPDWLFNATNDAWFGDSGGPHQHFAIARMRAVEQGLPVVRAANTGISAVIDPYGRILTRLGLGESGSRDVVLPAPLAPTFYSALGDLPLLLGCGLLLIISVLCANRYYHS